MLAATHNLWQVFSMFYVPCELRSCWSIPQMIICVTLLLPHHTGSRTRSLENLSAISGGWMLLRNELIVMAEDSLLCAASGSLAAEDICMLVTVSSHFPPVF